jgi:hypothetical protein
LIGKHRQRAARGALQRQIAVPFSSTHVFFVCPAAGGRAAVGADGAGRATAAAGGADTLFAGYGAETDAGRWSTGGARSPAGATADAVPAATADSEPRGDFGGTVAAAGAIAVPPGRRDTP